MKIAVAPFVVALLAGMADPAAAFDPFARVLKPVEEANQLYEEQRFDQALDLYEQAEQMLQMEPGIHFNRGNALFKLGRPRQARDAYLRATGTDDPDLKKRNYYNIGNTFLSEGAFQDAISYYLRALKIDSEFEDARFNLELALMALRQKPQDRKGEPDPQDDKGDQKKQQEENQPDQQKKPEEKQDQLENQDQHQDQQEGQAEDPKQPDDQQQDKEEQQDSQADQQEEKPPGEDQQDQQDHESQQQQGEEHQDKQDLPRPPDSGGGKPREESSRMSKAQIKDLLDAMRENEKPFQMDRLMLPEFKKNKVDKDW